MAAAITCYWGSVSQPSRALKAFLDDAAIPHQSRHVDMLKSENYTDPEILKYSPAGSLPFLVIDGVVYKETVALMRYLCGKYPDTAMKFYAPADDLETRYEIDKWCDFYTDAFRPAFVREQGAKYQVLGAQREGRVRHRLSQGQPEKGHEGPGEAAGQGRRQVHHRRQDHPRRLRPLQPDAGSQVAEPGDR